MNQKKTYKLLSENRRARFNYEILDTIEAGIVLIGTEVKSLRANHANISNSYANFERKEFWLINAHIAPYTGSGVSNHDPERLRKLLINKKQMSRFFEAVSREGLTIVPLKLYFNEKGRVKIDLALARGKKLHDKRETEKRRDWDREKSRLFRNHR